MYNIAAIILFSIASVSYAKQRSSDTSFKVDYDNNQFLLDGEPFQYISGSIHYFRIHPSMWKDRLKRVRSLGFNAVQFYIPWNFHELEEGKIDFTGMRDWVGFVKEAEQQGLYTLLRVGPYVCGEWENGGLPWWILKKSEHKMRSAHPIFKSLVDKWFSVLLPMVRPLLRENGGPILMVQIENEYGSYDACDKNYTTWLRDLALHHLGQNTVLYTTDGGSDGYLKCGAIDKVLPTVDFGPSTQIAINASFQAQRKYLPNGKGPLVNSEFYPGWLVLWGQTTQSLPSTDDIISSAKYMFDMGANINFYMIHGGTNFAFWNGAETNAPCITSYDYGAPISEAGDITENYKAIRTWIKAIPNWKNKPLNIPLNNKKTAYGNIKTIFSDSFESLNHQCKTNEFPLSFEEQNHGFGYAVYLKTLDNCGTNLSIPLLKDFGFTFLENEYIGTFINHLEKVEVRQLTIPSTCKKGDTLRIIVENQGRQTYETINDKKGILSDVHLDGVPLLGWTQCGIDFPLDKDVKKIIRKEKKNIHIGRAGTAGVFMMDFNVKEITDTFIDTTGWGKGVILINGHHIGRYWASKGPQMTLYVPAAFLVHGPNSVMVVEFESSPSPAIMRSIDYPIFNLHTTNLPLTNTRRRRNV